MAEISTDEDDGRTLLLWRLRALDLDIVQLDIECSTFRHEEGSNTQLSATWSGYTTAKRRVWLGAAPEADIRRVWWCIRFGTP